MLKLFARGIIECKQERDGKCRRVSKKSDSDFRIAEVQIQCERRSKMGRETGGAWVVVKHSIAI